MLDGKIIAVLVGEQIGDCAVEIIEIIRAMKNMNARVKVISSPRKRYFKIKNDIIRVDIAIDQAHTEDYDAIILCSECRSTDSSIHEYCTRFLRGAYDQGKIIAAIGDGIGIINTSGFLPADSRIIKAKNFNGYNRKAGKPVFKDANLIIARDSVSLVSFVHEIIKALK